MPPLSPNHIKRFLKMVKSLITHNEDRLKRAAAILRAFRDKTKKKVGAFLLRRKPLFKLALFLLLLYLLHDLGVHHPHPSSPLPPAPAPAPIPSFPVPSPAPSSVPSSPTGVDLFWSGVALLCFYLATFTPALLRKLIQLGYALPAQLVEAEKMGRALIARIHATVKSLPPLSSSLKRG